MNTKKKYTVSHSYTRLPAAMLAEFMGWIGTSMNGNASFPNPPVPLVPPVSAKTKVVAPDAPVDLQTLQTNLHIAIVAAVGGGLALTAAKNAAVTAAIEALDSLAFYVQTVARFDVALLLTSGFQAASNNRARVALQTPTILGIDNNQPTQLWVHLTPITNAYGYEVQVSIGGGAWTTVKYSTQARTIILIDLISGTLYNVRARALGGSTDYSGWSMPGSRYVT